MKRLPIEIKSLSLKELRSCSDAAPRMIGVFSANPFSASDASIAKIAGYCEGVEAGYEFVFPLRLQTPIGEIDVLAGSSLFVNQEYRRSGLGMDLPELRWQKSPSKVALGAALSQMALPVHQLLDYNVFLLPRYIMLWRSRSVVEMRLKGVFCKVISFIIDFGIFFYSLLLRVGAAWCLRGIRVDEVGCDDEQTLNCMAELVAADSALFSEVHDGRWFKWHMTRSLSKDGPLRLFVAKSEEDIVGFCMIKKRFHEQASHRGFRNVWLGSIVEWQMKNGYEKKLGWLLVRIALKLKSEGMDAAEIPTADASLNRFLRRIGWRQVGESNFVIKAGEGSTLYGNEDMKDPRNWRLRPAMGDAGLS